MHNLDDLLKMHPHEVVALLNRYREALEKLARLGNGDHYGNSIGNQIAIRAITPDPQP